MYKYFIILVIILLTYTSKSQKLNSPIDPVKNITPTSQNIGVLIGLGQNYANGDHYVDCQECVFNGGVGFGLTLGAYYEREATNWLWYGGLIRFDILGIESKFIENESVEVDNGNKNFIIPFEQTASSSLNYFNFTPYVSFRPFSWFRLNTGLNVGLNISNNLQHTKKPLKNEVIDPTTGDVYEISVINPDSTKTGSNKYELMNGKFPEINSPYMTLYFNFGFPITFKNDSQLIPSLSFDYPISNVSNFGKNFNIGTWRLNLAFSYPLIKSVKELTSK